MQIVVDKLLTNYQLSGKGKLVVLLHGWGDSLSGLSVLQTQLQKTYRVLSIDLPGFGGTQAPLAAWNLDDYAQFVGSALKKLDLQEPYALIGHSNGGAIAVRAMGLKILHPQKLVLLAASGIRDSDPKKRLGLTAIAKTGKVVTVILPISARQKLRQKLYKASGSDMLVSPNLAETFKKVVRQDVQQDARSITIPTLLLYAANDKAVPVAHAHRYHELIKGSQLEIIEQSGHFVHSDQPEKVNQCIKEFLG